MNYYQIAEHIQEKYLKPLESFEINNLQDVSSFHDELIKINVDLITKVGFPVMPHYRGEQNYGWDILPGIFRPPFSTEIDLSMAREIEKNGAEIFKRKVIENYGEDQLFKHSKKPYGEDWDLMFQAQHAGIKTNLIDLSTSSVSSSYFMCEPSDKHEHSDGQFWGLLVPHDFILNETSDYGKLLYPNFNPFDLDSSFVCNVPTYINDIDQRTYQFRLFRQHGRLFASSNSDLEVPLNKKEFWKNMIVRVRVKAEAKKVIFEELKANGIDK
ncbi:FRG domain-containing protein [uncultured Winogradskyella sp.]|uniref:FRG domain-containing protein n=1 Tax=uncultured Winogradskyella sp. TaxID=395353 RepID=UPI002614B75D|nr:FRG domain-containing protein [uncultured Winogradskyella sp.]